MQILDHLDRFLDGLEVNNCQETSPAARDRTFAAQVPTS